MSEVENVLETLSEFLGTTTDSAAMGEAWVVSPFEDAWLVRPKIAKRGAHLFLVQHHTVQPVQLARTTLDEAYQELRLRNEDGAGGT